MIHAVVTLTITDQETFDAYAAQAGAALAKYGASPVAMSKAPTRIEGDGPVPTRIVVLAFPDRAAAMGWIEDPDLAEVHALRQNSGACDIYLLD